MDQELNNLTTVIQQLRSEVSAYRQENVLVIQKVQSLHNTILVMQAPIPVPRQVKPPGTGFVPVTPPGMGPPISGRMPNPPMPRRYGGDPKDYTQFLTQCRLHFLNRPEIYATDVSMTTFILMNLEGTALLWATPLIDRTDPILQNYPAFLLAFSAMFERRQERQVKKQELLDLRQGGRDTLTYVTQFRLLASTTAWPDDVLIPHFYRGLKEEMKDFLTQIMPLPDTMEMYIALVLQADQRMGERRKERRKGEGFRPYVRTHMDQEKGEEPMQIGGTRGPLTPVERERRRRNNLCFYCGDSGHSIGICPKVPKGGKSGNGQAR